MYDFLASFAQTGGLIFFIAIFAGVVAYALWPRNQAKFDRAARLPLEDDDRPNAGRPTDQSRDDAPRGDDAPARRGH